jgi:pilus assembly protein CpaD
MYKHFSRLAASKTSVFVLLAVSASLAGCSADELAVDDQYVPLTHYERYPIKVAKAPIKLEISSQHGTLQPSQINAISGFARSARNAIASKITIHRPSSGGASRQVASQTYQLLLQSGISPSMIVQATYPGPAKGPVQLSYLRSVAVTKECGDWSSDMADTSNNQPYSDMGCSIQNNIAAMVVNPEDFVVPEVTTPALAAMRVPGAAGSTTAAATSTSSAAAGSGSGSTPTTSP